MPINEISTQIKKRNIAKDRVYTPIEVVKNHLKIVKEWIKEGDFIYEPFFGKGAYYNLYGEFFKNCNFDFSEIDLNKDFFKYDKKVDVICSNPPYSIIDKVLEHSIKLNPRLISYLLCFHALTPRRIEYMNKAGYYLKHCYMLKIYEWYGISLITTFEKSEDKKNCIDFDRIVYRI